MLWKKWLPGINYNYYNSIIIIIINIINNDVYIARLDQWNCKRKSLPGVK